MTDEEKAARAEKRAQESGDGLPFESTTTAAKAKTEAEAKKAVARKSLKKARKRLAGD